ncbi:uncharacterized protein LOC142559536 [Dermacentor variabilis]|uniref:uncharacterized protein LOC142559536 n=1 Tax=Dermacentor variabilis TaxID=34621 RepID=UPI003F5C7AFA
MLALLASSSGHTWEAALGRTARVKPARSSMGESTRGSCTNQSSKVQSSVPTASGDDDEDVPTKDFERQSLDQEQADVWSAAPSLTQVQPLLLKRQFSNLCQSGHIYGLYYVAIHTIPHDCGQRLTTPTHTHTHLHKKKDWKQRWP